MRRHALLLVLAISALPAVAHAEEPAAPADPQAKAQAHLARAAAAHKEGRFGDARTELNAAYSLDPQPQILYALGQVYVKLGQCGEAIMFYEQFLDSKPAPAAADSARQAIDVCRVASAQQAAQKPPATGEPLEDLDQAEAPPNVPAEGPPVAAQVDGPRPYYKDPIQIALVGGGAASLLIGALYYSSAGSRLDDAEAAASYEASAQLVDDARGQRTMSVVFTVAGLGLVGGGIYYYFRTHHDRERSSVTVVPTRDGGVVSWSGRF